MGKSRERIGVFSKTILFSYSAWLICYLLFPGKYFVFNDSPESTIFIFGNVFLLIFSYEFFRIAMKKRTGITTGKSLKRFHFIIIVILSLFGVASRLYVRIVKEGLLTYSSFSQFRLATLNNPIDNGIIDILSAITYPFSFILLLIILDRKFYVGGFLKYISVILGLYVFIDTIILGSRLQLVLFGLIVLLTLRDRSFFKKVRLRHVIALSSIACIFILYSMNIIFDRIEEMGIGSDVVSFWEYGHDAVYDRSVHGIDINTLSGRFTLSLVSIQHYFVHGFFEFKRLFGHNLGESPLLLGKEQFNIVYKFFELALNIEPTDTSMFRHKTGVYTTFWGVVFLDWGWFSFVYSIILGWFLSLLESTRNHSYPSLILYRFFIVILSGCAFINLFIGSNLYFFFSAVSLYIILKLKI